MTFLRDSFRMKFKKNDQNYQKRKALKKTRCNCSIRHCLFESRRQNVGAKNKVYDNKGRLLSNGKDLCDCLDVDCMGCFYPCPECGSRRCGIECRCDRKWLYEQMEVEGGEIIRNKFAI